MLSKLFDIFKKEEVKAIERGERHEEPYFEIKSCTYYGALLYYVSYNLPDTKDWLWIPNNNVMKDKELLKIIGNNPISMPFTYFKDVESAKAGIEQYKIKEAERQEHLKIKPIIIKC